MDQTYKHERKIAELAVQRAAIATKTVFDNMKNIKIDKTDNTPVSVADFAAQSLLVAAIQKNFPGDKVLGEEDSQLLQNDHQLRQKVWEIVQSTHLEDVEAEKLLGSPNSMEQMLEYIDIGGKSNQSSPGRVWIFDPVDGTKTFLLGGHYVVCCAFMVDGVQQVAAFAAPHITLEHGRISESDIDLTSGGYVISATKDKGAQMRPLSHGALNDSSPITKKPYPGTKPLIYTESLGTETNYIPGRKDIVESLGSSWPPVDIYSTQLRYLALALGVADFLLRLPKDPPTASSHIWDHAGGILVFQECGGKVTDIQGREMDFTTGRDLTNNVGIVAAPAYAHAKVLKAVQEELKHNDNYKEYFQ
jgi:3'(2'), 5'-bisphosphate nucleotidase